MTTPTFQQSATKIIRRPWGQGFTYRQADRIVDAKTRRWIKSLVIPPAWQDVEIDPQKNAKVIATGRDNKGRKQYIYSERWRQQQEEKKFERIIEFADNLTPMRRETSVYLRDKSLTRRKVLSCMVRLIDNAYFRPGSPRYSAENDSYGLTTLRSKHLEISGSRLEFHYTGKSGIEQTKVIDDARLTDIVRSLEEVPGYEIFKYFDEAGNKVYVDAADLNDFIREIMGEGFSSKDFRTWAGTYLAATLLDQLGASDSEKQRDQKIIEAVDQVAAKLGNTRSVARANYIDPRVIEEYSVGRTIGAYIEEVAREIANDDDFTSQEEKAVRSLLCEARQLLD